MDKDFKNICLLAGAGSGKTRILTLRIIRLLLSGVSPSEIYSITFSKKAALEIKERVFEKLFELTQIDEKNAYIDSDLHYILGKKHIEKSDIESIRRRSKKVLENLIEGLSELKVSTIHSFFYEIIRNLPKELGKRRELNVADDVIFYEILDEALQHTIRAQIEDEKLSYEIEKLFAFLGDTLDLKRLLKRFLKEFLEKELEVEILWQKVKDRYKDLPKKLFDTKKELEEIVKKLICDLRGPIGTKTFISLREELKNAAEIGNWDLIIGSKFLKKESIKDIRGFKSLEKVFDSSKIYEIDKNFYKLRKSFAKYLELRNLSFTKILFDIFFQFLSNFKRLLEQKGIITFSEIENLCYRYLVLSNQFDRDYLYFKLDSRISHLLIDEFQDTNVIEWEILKPIAEELISGVGASGKRGSFFYVGDTKQAIYRFRGGQSELFKKVLKDYDGFLEFHRLTKNYRSRKNIVEFINNLFCSIKDYEYTHQEAIKPNGYVEFKKSSDETLLSDLKEMLEKVKENGFDLKKTAVLLRSNEEVKRVSQFLEESGFETESESKNSLIDSFEIKKIISFLKYIANGEEINLLEFVVSPFFDEIDEKKLFFSLAERPILEILGDKRERIEELKREKENLTLFSFIMRFFETYNIFQKTAEFENILIFLDTVLDFQAKHGSNLRSFIEYMENFGKGIEQKREKRGISVMTIHKAKGLEFQTVFVLNSGWRIELSRRNTKFLFIYDEDLRLSDIRIFPKRDELEVLGDEWKKIFDKEWKKVLEDELNLFYVALTRAKDNLLILGTPKGDDILSIFPKMFQESFKIGEMKIVEN